MDSANVPLSSGSLFAAHEAPLRRRGDRAVALRIGPEMAIGVHGELDIGVADPGLHLLRGRPLLDPERSRDVAQLVKSEGGADDLALAVLGLLLLGLRESRRQ